MIARLTLVIGSVALAASAVRASPPPPRKPSGMTRTVQLISMLPTPAPEPSATSEPIQGVTDADAAKLPDDFRIHDLSRRWVERQMTANFAPLTESMSSADGAFSPVTDRAPATLSSHPLPLPFSTISVPAWMRSADPFRGAGARYAPGCDPTPYRPSGLLPLGSEARRQTYYGMMSSIACQYGLPIGLFDAMIIRESRYNPGVYSPKMAFGLTQLMPGTAADLGVNRYDIEQNLRGGAKYLRQQLDRFGQYHLALAAYNAGPGRVRGAVPRIAETRAYVDNVLLNWSRLSGLQRTVTVQTASSAPLAARSPLTRDAAVTIF